MKRVSLILGMCFGLLFLGACGETATEKAKDPNVQKVEEKKVEGKKEEKTAKEAKLKAVDNKPDEVVGVLDLIKSILADKEGWAGKEVTVKGRVISFATSGSLNTMTLKNDEKAENVGNTIACTTDGANLKDMLGKDVTVKGTIDKERIDDDSAWLKPCELKSQSGGDEKKDEKRDDKKEDPKADKDTSKSDG